MTNDEQLNSIFGGDWHEMTNLQTGDTILVVAATTHGRIGIAQANLQHYRIIVELAGATPSTFSSTGPDRWLSEAARDGFPRFAKTVRIDKLTCVVSEAKNAIRAHKDVAIALYTKLPRWAFPVVNEFD